MEGGELLSIHIFPQAKNLIYYCYLFFVYFYFYIFLGGGFFVDIYFTTCHKYEEGGSDRTILYLFLHMPKIWRGGAFFVYFFHEWVRVCSVHWCNRLWSDHSRLEYKMWHCWAGRVCVMKSWSYGGGGSQIWWKKKWNRLHDLTWFRHKSIQASIYSKKCE